LTVLIDSWCWIEYIEDSKKADEIEKILDSNSQIYISVINIAEVYKRVLEKHSEKLANEIINFMSERCFLIPVDNHIALTAAILNNKLKIGLGDSLIYASAKVNNLKLATGDSHFKDKDDVIYFGE
jgi:predicted nucleic acid-binding protein